MTGAVRVPSMGLLGRRVQNRVNLITAMEVRDMYWEKQQADAESAEWRYIGRGTLLHAFVGQSKIAECGRGPGGVTGAVWVDAEPCMHCLSVVRRNDDRLHPFVECDKE